MKQNCKKKVQIKNKWLHGESNNTFLLLVKLEILAIIENGKVTGIWLILPISEQNFKYKNK